MAVFRSPVMVGRDRELDRLRTVVAGVVDRGEPAFVVIEGEPGVGKTRLAEDLTGSLDSALRLTGHGMALASGGRPFGVLSEALRDLVLAVGVDRVRAVGAEEVRSLVGLVPALAVDGAGAGPVDRAAVFGATAELLQRLADDRLVVVFIDDLQWADDESLDVVEYVGRVAHDCRLLLLTTVRISDTAEERFADRLAGLHRMPGREFVTLGRLSAGEVAEQVRHLLGRDVDDATVSAICRLSEGVPFFVEELAGSGMAAGRALPASVRRLVLTRLPELSDDARDVLDAATVGESHTYHLLLLRATGMERARFEAATTEAINAGVLEVAEDGQDYRFRHALLREALDQAMNPGRRIHWNEQWARTLSDAHAPLSVAEAVIAVAQHWDAAGDPEQALHSAVAAARAAAQLAAPKQEAEFWQRAFNLWPTDTEDVDGVTKGEVAVRLVIARGGASQSGEALDWCRATLGSGVDDPALELWLRLCEQDIANTPGAPGTNFVTPEMVPALVEQAASFGCSWPAENAIHLLWIGFADGDSLLFDRVDGLLDSMSRDLGDEDMQRGVMRQRAWRALLTHGRADKALRHFEGELEHARLRSTPPGELHLAEANVMLALLAHGSAAEAVDVGTAALRTVAVPEMAPVSWGWLALQQGRGLLALGRPEQMRDLMDRGSQLVATDFVVRSLDGPLQVRVDARRGDLSAATSMLDDLVGEGAIFGDPFPRFHCIGYADLAFGSGKLSYLESLGPELSESWLIASSHWTWELVLNALRAAVCPLAGQPGPDDEAAKWTDAADRLYRLGELGTAWSLEVVALRGRIAESDGPEDWSAAVEAWDRIGYRFDEAVCRLRLGEALLREGRREQASEQLARAFSIAAAVEAKPLAEAVRRSARLARLPLDGDMSTDRSSPGALTPRESEVLALIARGRTNEQIGSELYMSPKTASVHVSRIITKLGAANRTEAAALARNLGLLD